MAQLPPALFLYNSALKVLLAVLVFLKSLDSLLDCLAVNGLLCCLLQHFLIGRLVFGSVAKPQSLCCHRQVIHNGLALVVGHVRVYVRHFSRLL